MSTKLGFIGGGNMAASLIGGLLSPTGSPALIDAGNLWVFDKDLDKLAQLRKQYGVQCAEHSQQLIAECDAVVLAVKPQVLEAVLSPLAESFKSTTPLLISVVAGIRSDTIERWIGRECAVVRVMPNTPALIGAGASGMYANRLVTAEQKTLTTTLLDSVGMTRWVDEENAIDLVTALSGSGPAYFMLFISSLIDAAVSAGMDEATARALALQTALGSAQLVAGSDQSIESLIKNITSPGGTTEQAVKSFHDSGLSSIVADAFSAARRRSEQLAIELDQ
ncbi:MAG: pyrroline-5-carboxylate reductase [Gammaproteobacteria bacterium]|nr:pyrroline-5-carboxylate reductase [Gammaproteobacteria bacterium]